MITGQQLQPVAHIPDHVLARRVLVANVENGDIFPLGIGVPQSFGGLPHCRLAAIATVHHEGDVILLGDREKDTGQGVFLAP